MRRSKSSYVIQTVANGLRILEEFGGADAELGVTELSNRLSLHKNNVFRLLATLEQQGYVEQCAQTERYRLGPACLALGRAFTETRSLVRAARATLAMLAEETNESAHLGVLSGYDVVHLDGQQPAQLVATTLRIGQNLAAHCTALGKVLLAGKSAAALAQLDKERVRAGKLVAQTPATITDRDKFFEHLRTVASQGWALDLEECAQGLCCVAAPVHDASGAVIAALSVSAPIFRVSEARIHDQVMPRVIAAANELSLRMGYATAH
ncbi:MAG TPA: IclR family transcriptional regulator [Myxococcota bacterium]|jgi:DNA-binding IclR family transcriptional regulator